MQSEKKLFISQTEIFHQKWHRLHDSDLLPLPEIVTRFHHPAYTLHQLSYPAPSLTRLLILGEQQNLKKHTHTHKSQTLE
jgi:hypothetical protein